MNDLEPTSDATYQLRRSLNRLQAHRVSPIQPTLVKIDTRPASKAFERAAARPMRTGFLWSLGNTLGDIVGGILRLIVMLALLAGLAAAAYYGLHKAPDKKPAITKPR